MIKIDVAIPIFNEADSIKQCLESVIKLIVPADTKLKIYVIKKINFKEGTKEFEATNLGPSCPLFIYNKFIK